MTCALKYARRSLFGVLLITPLLLCAKERIVTLSPAINEIVYALGAGDDVVGNTTYSLYPEASKTVAKVGGYFSPNLEKILALRPTLVIMQPNNAKLAAQLTKLHIKTMTVPIDRLAHIKDSILKLGKRLHKSDKAKAIVARIDEALKQTQGIVKNKKILIVFGHNTVISGNIFVAGQNLYFDDIITASGNTNALHSDRKGQPVLNRENIIALNPDIVILLARDLEKLGLHKNDLIDPWLSLPIRAAKQRNIYLLDKAYDGIPSDRLVLFLQDFKAILHAAKDH
ncbi:MAG: helical backbone metal receptor [Sulfurovum sp.]|nr:helical backbone metal receptor [Sulfurovum sp.]